ncbi:MAG: ribose 5-phosphate isomerase B [Candidatus Moranbacteria bacterium]|nr:ribose 5-phosphate isomerase B [Candidatus Moranbacteria bacterium]
MTKKIAIAADHGGYKLKEQIKKWLKKQDYQVLDQGTDSEESVDYPVFAAKASVLITSGQADLGILICSSGVGMSIAANRFAGVRASLCCNKEMAKHTREHNLSNVLCLGAHYLKKNEAFEILEAWLNEKPGKKSKYLKRSEMLDELAAPGCAGCF